MYYLCTLCNKDIKKEATIKSHIITKKHIELYMKKNNTNKNIGVNPKYKCNICNKIYINKGSYDSHYNSHIFEYISYKCEKCNKTYKHTTSFSRHYKDCNYDNNDNDNDNDNVYVNCKKYNSNNSNAIIKEDKENNMNIDIENNINTISNLINISDLPINIKNILLKNNNEYINKFMKKIVEKPFNDCEGFIYGFTYNIDKNTKNNYWIKIGRTYKKNPHHRINQWHGNIEFCQKTKYNKKLEKTPKIT